MSSVLIWSMKFMASVRSFILIVKDLLRYSFFDVMSRSDFGRTTTSEISSTTQNTKK